MQNHQRKEDGVPIGSFDIDKAGRHQQLPNIIAGVTTHVVDGSIMSRE